MNERHESLLKSWDDDASKRRRLIKIQSEHSPNDPHTVTLLCSSRTTPKKKCYKILHISRSCLTSSFGWLFLLRLNLAHHTRVCIVICRCVYVCAFVPVSACRLFAVTPAMLHGPYTLYLYCDVSLYYVPIRFHSYHSLQNEWKKSRAKNTANLSSSHRQQPRLMVVYYEKWYRPQLSINLYGWA